MQENDFLASLAKRFATNDPAVLVGSGPDDCAHVACGSGRLAFSADAFAEGSHFLATDSPRDVARKALAASVSDLAASACRPRWALVSLCLKQGTADGWAAAFADSLAETAREYGVSVIGGDLLSAREGVFVSVTVVGEPYPGGPVLRGGGRPGDAVVVTGALGGSLRGRHLAPRARVREMAELMRFCAAVADGGGGVFPSAAMDVSDGLALDLSRLCRESGVGATVEEALIPVSAAAREAAAASGRRAVDHALADGEDFELLLALPPGLWEAFSRHCAGGGAPSGLAAFTRIGVLTAGADLAIIGADGHSRRLAPEGFQHQW